MAIIELLLIIFQTLILSTVFTTVLLLIVFVLLKTLTNNLWTKRVLKKKISFWLVTHFIISVLLLVLSFSYSQDTGIGDNSKISVGYGQTIQIEDFAWTYFFPDRDKTEPNQDELIIGKYKITDAFLCAEVSHQNTNSPSYDYTVYDLKIKSMQTLLREKDYVSLFAFSLGICRGSNKKG